MPQPSHKSQDTFDIIDDFPNSAHDLGNLLVCHVSGTQIAALTAASRRKKLKVGDLIVSEDGAANPVLFIGCQTFNAQSIKAFTQLSTVTIVKGTTAASTPLHDLHVFSQHHIPVRAPELQTLFGFDPAFVAACDMPYARPGSATETTYVHLVCATHTWIRANGCESETRFPGDTALLSMSLDHRRDFCAALNAGLNQKTAYPCLTAQEAAVCRSAIQSREKRAA